jgi:hypothetical protein
MHSVLEDCLHQAMNAENLTARCALHIWAYQRIRQQRAHCSIECEPVSQLGSKGRSQSVSSIDRQIHEESIGGQKRQQVQQSGRASISLTHFLKREGPEASRHDVSDRASGTLATTRAFL